MTYCAIRRYIGDTMSRDARLTYRPTFGKTQVVKRSFRLFRAKCIYYRYKFRNKFFANWRHETRTRTRVIVVGALKECALSEAVHARALGTLRECFDGPRQSSTAFGRATGARPVPHSTRIAQCSSCSRRVFIPFTVG